MIKAILILIFVLGFSGCDSKSDIEHKKLMLAKARAACINYGGLSYHTYPDVFFNHRTIAHCRDGSHVEYSNMSGPAVSEEYNKIVSEKDSK